MRSDQYSYQFEPPRRAMPEWLLNLFRPPQAYVLFLAGLSLGVYLSAIGNVYGPRILILLIAFPIHELAHALVADYLGDPTPRNNGQVTLNPFAQLNLLGSILMLGVGLGFAYVPINPSYLRPNPRTGHMLVAIAGPLSNLALAILLALIWLILSPALLTFGDPSVADTVFNVFIQLAFINMALFFFNLIPIAPLDGFAVLKGLLPMEMSYQYERLQAQYGTFIFFGLFILDFVTGGAVFGPLIFEPAVFITRLIFGIPTA